MWGSWGCLGMLDRLCRRRTKERQNNVHKEEVMGDECRDRRREWMSGRRGE
jgi:hypothetical protein